MDLDTDSRSSPLAISQDAMAKLESLARARGIDPSTALHHLIDSATDYGRLDTSSFSFRNLSSRQRRVLEHLKAGFSVKEIAIEMGVSERTIRTHIQRARASLGCSDILSLRYL